MTQVAASGLADALRDRYTLERELGRGGMATVYLARDLRHDRPVALKVLRPELALALGPERFLREIHVTARLQHPHILPVFDSGAAAGQLWYAMPYVAGESLRQRLTRDRRLSLDEALRITREVADALEHAHAQGVVHRDIKPENILLAGQHALVADFGIAKAAQGGAEHLTETGLSVGTVVYMSPEQASGAREVDGRSDLYSLGCVLYEMLTGEPPHSGATAQAIISKRVMLPPPSALLLRTNVPEAVDRALQRALASVPADRFATAVEFAEALGATAAPHPEPSGSDGEIRSSGLLRRSLVAAGVILAALALAATWRLCCPRPQPVRAMTIAALPFRVADPALGAYREGLVDYYSSALDGPGGLRAIGARTTLKHWYALVGRDGEGDDEAVQSVARQVGARFALTGAVIPLGSGIRLTAVLRDFVADSVIKAEADGPADSIAVLAGRVGASLLRRIAGPEARLVTGGPFATRSLEALTAYLAGEKAFRAALYREAMAHFDRAIAADSTFALAQFRRGAAAGWTMSPHQPGGVHPAVLADLPHLGRHDSLLVRGSWELNKGLRAALRSLESLTVEYPEDPEGWFLLGDAYYHGGMNYGVPQARVDSAFRRAILLDSTFAPAYLHLIEDGFARFDSAEVRLLVSALSRFDSSSPKTTGLTIAWLLAFGADSQRQRAQGQLSLWGADELLPAKHALNLNPDLAEWTVLVGRTIFSNSRNTQFERGQGLGGAGESLELRGAFHESWPMLIRAQELFDSSGSPWVAAWSEIAPAVYRLEGLPVYPRWDALQSPERLAAYDPTRSNDPNRIYMLGEWGLARKDWDVVARAVSALRHMSDTLTGGPSLPESMNRIEDRAWTKHLARELETWGNWLRHPSEANLRDFEQATDSLRNYDYSFPSAPDFLLGKAYLSLGDLARAERHMLVPQRWSSGFFTELIVPREYFLGQIADKRGNRAEAREHYARFVRWWRNCDPELRPWWEEARQALEGVTGDPRGGGSP